MALESPALADALVAWSAGHLASRQNSYRPTELAARSKSLQSLVLSLSSCDAAKSGINAATSLILMTSEVCLGFHTNWYSHLIGMKDIITAAHFPTSTSDSVLLGPWNGETKMRRKGELRHAFETRYRAGWVCRLRLQTCANSANRPAWNGPDTLDPLDFAA